MNLESLKSAAMSLIDQFRASKGRKPVDAPVVPVAPLIKRLNLPELPSNIKDDRRKAAYVFMEIAERFPKQVSKRVLGKIVRHYGVDLRGHGFFRVNRERPNMLLVLRPQSA